MDFFTFGDHMEVIRNPLGLFTVQHFFALLLLTALGIFLVRSYVRNKAPLTLRRKVALVILFLEIIRQAVFLITGSHEWEFLPLHLCAFGVHLILIDACYENKYTKEIIFMLTFPGALAALLTPDWVTNPLFNFFTIQSFLIHALMVIYAWMRYCTGEIKPKLRNIWMPALFLTIVVPIIILVNHTLETNFFFLMTGPEGTPLATLQAQFGSLYLVSLITLLLIVWLIMYAILGLKERILKHSGCDLIINENNSSS